MSKSSSRRPRSSVRRKLASWSRCSRRRFVRICPRRLLLHDARNSSQVVPSMGSRGLASSWRTCPGRSPFGSRSASSRSQLRPSSAEGLPQGGRGQGLVLARADRSEDVAGAVTDEAEHPQPPALGQVQRKDRGDRAVRASARGDQERAVLPEVVPPGAGPLPGRERVPAALRQGGPVLPERIEVIVTLQGETAVGVCDGPSGGQGVQAESRTLFRCDTCPRTSRSPSLERPRSAPSCGSARNTGRRVYS